MIYSSTMDTPAGPFTVLADDEAVLASGWTSTVDDLLPLVPPMPRPEPRADLGAFTKAVLAYHDGDLTAIDDIPVRQAGGPFLTTAWTRLRAVPAGTPVTYTELAALAGRPAAVRAAAQACARNAAALFVPCHRVIRLDRTLGGFRWGLPVKQWLLAHESSPAHALPTGAGVGY
jgi:methylated-DNA-[protein]-cysteine S-methyltransferase